MKDQYVVLVTPDRGSRIIAVSIIDESRKVRVFSKVQAVKLQNKLRAQFNDADYDVYKLVKVEG